MTIQLQSATDRETATAVSRERERIRTALARNVLDGASLIRETESAVASVVKRTGVKLSEHESLALIQHVTMLALSAHRERMLAADEETLAARSGERRMLRSDVGRKYLAALTRGALKERDGWRDTLDGYRTRSERERGMPAVVAGSRDAVEDRDDDGETSGKRDWLSIATERERMRSTDAPVRFLAVAPADVADLAPRIAEALADALAVEDERDRRRILATVESAAGVPLIRQSERPGAPSIATLKRDSASGALLIRERMPARDVAALVRDVAETDVAERVLVRMLRTSFSVETERAARAALVAVETVRHGLYRCPAGPLPGPRTRVENYRPVVRPLYGCATGPLAVSAIGWQRSPLRDWSALVSRSVRLRVSNGERSSLRIAARACGTCGKWHAAEWGPVMDGLHPSRSSLI